jgi:hypothetical protein
VREVAIMATEGYVIQVAISTTWHINFFKLRFWLDRAYRCPSPGQYKQLCKRKGGLIRPAYGRGPTSQALKWAHICALEVEVPFSALFVLVGYVAQPTGRTGSSNKQFGIALSRRTAAKALILNESA